MPIRLIRTPIRAGGARAADLEPGELMSTVHALSFPRPVSDSRAIALAADIVVQQLTDHGRAPVLDAVGNVVAFPPGDAPVTLVAAHYDSVEHTPGADDNASAVAVMLGISAALARAGSHKRVGFIAFNAEEDGIRGSAEWAERWSLRRSPSIRDAHVLEMLGFATGVEGSQRAPPGLPRWLDLPTTADFIGVLGNHGARTIVGGIVAEARRASDVKVVALQTWFGVERRLPSMDLSDHVRLWEHRIPTVLWTDTAFYRNPHYHLPSDTPDTLDPAFLSGVANLIYRVVAA